MAFDRRARRRPASSDPDDTESPEAATRRAYATSIKLLGSRDHSRAELTRKLGDRGFDDAVIVVTLNELVADRYIDDARYAQLYLEQRVARGYGARAIQSKLHERGIDSEDIDAAFDAQELDWSELAEQALLRKFRADQLLDTEERARGRIARFLQGRGFGTADSIRAIERARRAASDVDGSDCVADDV